MRCWTGLSYCLLNKTEGLALCFNNVGPWKEITLNLFYLASQIRSKSVFILANREARVQHNIFYDKWHLKWDLMQIMNDAV